MTTSATETRSLLELVHADFALGLVDLEPVGHGFDDAAQLWRGTSADRTSYAVKLTTGGSAAAVQVTDHLAATAGLAGVAGPVRTRAGRLWAELGDARLTVVPWLDAPRALEVSLTPEHWRSYGALLAGLHATSLPADLVASLPSEGHRHDAVAAFIRELDIRLHQPGREVDVDEHAQAVCAAWQGAADRVHAVLALADALAPRLRQRQAAAVPCHADPHLGNMLAAPDGQVWLLDWDDALLAPRERDLMFVVGGVLGPVSAEQLGWFVEGYGPVDHLVDRDRLTYYRCVRALEDVGVAAQALEVGARPTSERAFARAVVDEVLSPTGMVDRALAG